MLGRWIKGHVSATNVAAVLVALWVGSAFAEPALQTVTEIVEVEPSDYATMRAEVVEKNAEVSGLRDRIAGLEEREPSVVVRTDTVVTPPDTVIEVVSASAGGFLTISQLIATDSVNKFRPEILEGIDVRDCDDGFSIGQRVICNKARLGHLYLFGALPVEYEPLATDFDPWVGIYWEPKYRSAWRFSAGYTVAGRLRVELSRGWQIF